jgi:hypothetical protein
MTPSANNFPPPRAATPDLKSAASTPDGAVEARALIRRQWDYAFYSEGWQPRALPADNCIFADAVGAALEVRDA